MEKFKIIGLKVDGIKKLKAVEMQFTDKGLIPIIGKNQQGKTAILDSIEILLRGRRAAPHDIVQHGKEKAELEGKVGRYKIKRIISPDGNKDMLEVVDIVEKNIVRRPQQILDDLVNTLTFNPRPFLDKTPEQKLQFLMDLCGIDFTEIDSRIRQQEQERLLAGRELKRIGEPIPVEKTERVDITDIVAFNDLQKNRQADIDNAAGEIQNLVEAEIEIEEQIAKLQARLATTKSARESAEQHLSALPKPEPLKDISGIQEINDKAEAYEHYLQHKQMYDKAKEEREQADRLIQRYRNEKKKILAETPMPIKGLEIKEDGLYYNGIFCDNWSDSQADRISRELCLAMNPKLRAMFIDRGELYDEDSRKELEQWAVANDIQAFITIVDEIPEEAEPGVFYIEEGQLM